MYTDLYFLRVFSYVEVLHIHRYILTIQHVHQFFFIIFVIIKELMKQPGTCMSVFIIITCLNASYQKYIRFVARRLEKTKTGSCFSVNFRLDGFV